MKLSWLHYILQELLKLCEIHKNLLVYFTIVLVEHKQADLSNPTTTC